MSTATIESAKIPRGEAAANLKPKEHGAYAILAIPIVTAILVTGPTIVGLCVAVASLAGFMAHEPLLVALGRRGARAQRTTPHAQRRLGVLLTVTIAGGIIALVAGSTSVRNSLILCCALALVCFVLAIAGKHRTLGGQLWGIIGLSVPCVPILLAGDTLIQLAMEAWGTWLIGFGATTLAVRGVIASQKRQSRALHLECHRWSFARRCGTHMGWFSDSHRYATDDFYVLVLTLCPTSCKAAQTRGMDACWWDSCDSMLDGHHGLRQRDLRMER